jgi:hypothetical protein
LVLTLFEKIISTPYEVQSKVIGIGRIGAFQEFVYVENVVHGLLLIEKNFNSTAEAAGQVSLSSS